MKSRIGHKPNGIVTLKNPSKHFQESEFIKAIDEWSVSMKDNPVPHFAAKIKVKQVNVFPYFGIASTRKYEDRKARTVREFANPNDYNRMPDVAWNSVNLWNYNLEEKNENYSVNLLDTFYSQGCTGCSETGLVMSVCTSCAGRGNVFETDYSNNSRRPVRCISCNGHGNVEKQCRTCEGYGGFVNYIVCDVYYTYPNMKRFYCDDKVTDTLNKLNFEEAAFDLFSEVSTAAELVNFVQGTIKEDVTGDIISFVNSHDKEHQNFLGEQTQYGQSFISFVRFEYEDTGREYTVAIYGDKDFVYAPESPISQSAEKILDEANDFLVNHDFKSASSVLKMISNMGQRKSLLNEIVNRFQSNLALAHAHLATESKSEIAKANEKYHSKSLGNKNIKDSETYPIVTELLTLFAAPALIGTGLMVLKTGNAQITDAVINCSLLSAISFATFYVYSRKKDIGFKKLWKYLSLSLIFGWMSFDLSYSLRNDSIWVIGPLTMFVSLVASWIAGKLSDHEKLNLGKEGSEKFDMLLAAYNEKIPGLKKFFPREEFSYIDDEKKKDYQIASRELDETLLKSSEDPEMNLITDDEAKAA